MTTLSPDKAAIQLTNLWQNHGPSTYPIDVEALIAGAISKSGFSGSLSVEKKPFDSFEGLLKRVDKTDDWVIFLNSNIENERRIRFTLAHELGHFMCHRHLQTTFSDGIDSLNDFQTKIEKEANCFASALLMPANVVRKEFPDRTWNVGALQSIGSYFGCSLQSSGIRYVELSARKLAFVVSRDGYVLWGAKSRTAPFLSAFTSGDALPAQSAAASVSSGNLHGTGSIDSGYSWSKSCPCIESQYIDISGRGFQYTCIEFI